MPLVASVAVESVNYSIDRPYSYLVPKKLITAVVPGVRVRVPFSKNNRITLGIVLNVFESEEISDLKSIFCVMDESPVFSEIHLKLLVFMRERYYCTTFDAAKAVIPNGLWFNNKGFYKSGFSNAEYVSLNPDFDKGIRLTSKNHLRAIELLSEKGEMDMHELVSQAAISRNIIMRLKDKGCLLVTRKQTPILNNNADDTARLQLPVLNAEQNDVFTDINKVLHSDKPETALLYGVTGSGKTSVYIHLINECLKAGKTSVLLVPEISLTPQMIDFFASRFKDSVAVIHSELSTSDRSIEWLRIKSGKAKVVIGTRSAVFAPVDNLGIIIIDEEQVDSYKSENTPRYRADEIARFLCYKSNALLLLGSATPSITSMYKAINKEYKLFEIKHRFNETMLPEVSIVDMKTSKICDGCPDISLPLYEELKKNIDKGEQSILFINRRGSHKLVTCPECGFLYTCPNCSISLTYHEHQSRCICHYCNYSKAIDNICPECGSDLMFIGTGTQQVEKEIRMLFPDSSTIRMDADTVAAAGSHQVLFSDFITNNIPIMIGTQMITKGLNFENVTFVGVISADQSLFSEDYKAGEKTFSLLTQVVGRSGRGKTRGRALIQTYSPLNQTINQASRQDYMSFYNSEINLRRLQSAPPFTNLISVMVSGSDEKRVVDAINYVKSVISSVEVFKKAVLIGPAPLFVVKVNNQYRFRLIISIEINKQIRTSLANLISQFKSKYLFKGLSIIVDNELSEY